MPSKKKTNQRKKAPKPAGILKAPRRIKGADHVPSQEHLQFNEENLQANWDVNRRIRYNAQVRYKHPQIEEEYYKANTNQRVDILTDLLFAKYYTELGAQPSREERLQLTKVIKERVDSNVVTMTLREIAYRTNSWKTARDFFETPEFLKIMSGNGKLHDYQAFTKKYLSDAENLPEELKLRDKRLRVAPPPKELEQRFLRDHPVAEQDYYQKVIRERVGMLRDYALFTMLQKNPELDEYSVRLILNNDFTDMILLKLAGNAQNWATARTVLESPEFQETVKHFTTCSVMDPEYQDQIGIVNEFTRQHIDILAKQPAELEFRERMGIIKPNAGQLAENVRTVREKTQMIYGLADQADFFLMGKGSPAFDEMKEAIDKLAVYAQKKYQINKRDLIPEETRRELLTKTLEAISKTKAYLQYKQEQFRQDPDRRNHPDRQKHEQPRILASIQALEELEKFYFEQSLAAPGLQYRDASGDAEKRAAFQEGLARQKKEYLTNLASRQSKDKMGDEARLELYNDQDRTETAKILQANAQAQMAAVQPPAPHH